MELFKGTVINPDVVDIHTPEATVVFAYRSDGYTRYMYLCANCCSIAKGRVSYEVIADPLSICTPVTNTFCGCGLRFAILDDVLVVR